MYYKLFVLLFTALPGEHEIEHTITVETSHYYQSENSCLEAAAAIGFVKHPEMETLGVDFRCLEVRGGSLDGKIPHINLDEMT